MNEDLDERSIAFMALQAAKKMFKGPTADIYVCTICGKVQPPTRDKNLRCCRCDAPIKESLFKIQQLQRQMKGRNRVIKMQIAELIQETRILRQELHTLIRKPSEKPRRDDGNDYKPRGFKPEIYDIEFKGGKKMRVRVTSVEERSQMYYKVKKIEAKAVFVRTERVHRAMENIRRAMVDAYRANTHVD